MPLGARLPSYGRWAAIVRPSLETSSPSEPLEAASTTSAREYRHRICPVVASDITTPSGRSSATPPTVPAIAPVAGTSRLQASSPSSCTGSTPAGMVAVVLTVFAVSSRACTNGSPADTMTQASTEAQTTVTPRLSARGGATAYGGASRRRRAKPSSARRSAGRPRRASRYGQRSLIAAPGEPAGQRHQQTPMATTPTAQKTIAGIVTSRGCARRNQAQASPAATAVPAIGAQTGKPWTSSGAAGQRAAAPSPRPSRTEAAITTPSAAPR